MASKPDGRRLEAWQALLLAQRALLDRLEDDLRREHGLPLNSYEVLLFLSRAPERRLPPLLRQPRANRMSRAAARFNRPY